MSDLIVPFANFTALWEAEVTLNVDSFFCWISTELFFPSPSVKHTVNVANFEAMFRCSDLFLRACLSRSEHIVDVIGWMVHWSNMPWIAGPFTEHWPLSQQGWAHRPMKLGCGANLSDEQCEIKWKKKGWRGGTQQGHRLMGKVKNKTGRRSQERYSDITSNYKHK